MDALEVVEDATGKKIRAQFHNFLSQFQDDEAEKLIYLEQAKTMVANEKSTLYVDFNHILKYSRGLAEAIEKEFYRFELFLRAAILQLLQDNGMAALDLGPDSCWVAIYGMQDIDKIRDLKATKIGQLSTIRGTVIRTSEVRPELVVGTFRCLSCGYIIPNVAQQFKYTEPQICPVPNCGNRDKFHLIVDKSKFIDWQKIRAQENSHEIPSGGMPRSLDIILRHEIVEFAKPGDKCVFTGTLIVVPDVAQIASAGGRVESSSRAGTRSKDGYSADGVTGLKNLGVRDLTYKLAFLACTVQLADARSGMVNIRDESTALVDSLTPDEKNTIAEMKDDPSLYNKVVSSLAPTIFGHEEIKRGVLLMLLGGVQKTTMEGMKIRGDINVCIVGDPGTAKSQFLKYVVDFLPRAVYTSGKASSAAGLTVSVVKDEETKEFCIEAGALMLADNGICCIDEFDKMDLKDQVAIHEAMEQQSISIAKAGIQATLNARTSILAAANPVGGRYDKSRSLKANVDMTPAIMSRFDLFFVVLDECNDVTDYNIARHIVGVHQLKDQAITPEFSTEKLQLYIKLARTLKPILSAASQKLLAETYRKLRQNDSAGGSSYRITVRQLESMIRLSEALARLHFKEEIEPKHVREAARLLKMSIIHIESADVNLNGDDEDKDRSGDGGNQSGGAPGGQNGDSDNDDDDWDGKGDGSKSKRKSPRKSQSQSQSQSEGQSSSSSAKTPTVLINHEKFTRITKMLVSRLRQNEDVEENGLRQSELIDWYLKEIEDDIHSEQELLAERNLVVMVIRRLVNKDYVLLALKDLDEEPAEPRKSEKEKEADAQAKEESRYLVAHPNYIMQ